MTAPRVAFAAVAVTAAVAAGSASAAASAVQVLRSGGNAGDAAVAAAFTAAVAEPGLTSLGGGGFALVRHPDGTADLLDFFVDAPGQGRAAVPAKPTHFDPVVVAFPGADQVFHAGWGSVAVPGTLSGLLELHRTWGRLPFTEVTAPAIAAASSGVVLEPAQAAVLALLAGIVTLSQDGRSLFAPDGALVVAGDVLRNETYAAFLHSLGPADRGFPAPVASALASAMAEHGGIVTQRDLDNYRPALRQPLDLRYGPARVRTNPPPSFGGMILQDALAALALGDPQRRPGAADVVDALVVAGDAHRARSVGSGAPQAVTGTTHLSVVDGDGLVVSMTTSNGSCSGVFVPGTGVQLNNVMGERDLHPHGFHAAAAGTRIGSMMAPTVLDLPDRTVVALGSGGSERIRSALLQVLVRLVEGSGLAHAIGAPRVHPDGRVVQAEPGLPRAALVDLAGRGAVNVWAGRDLYFGGVQAVARHPDASVFAAGDPRRGGVGRVISL